MSGNIKENVTQGSIWLRLVWMIVLGIAFSLTEILVVAVAVFQFLSSLFTGNANENLTRFGGNLARYLQKIVMFETFAVEEKPFPFSPWPDEVQGENIEQEIKAQPAGSSESDEVVTTASKQTSAIKKPTTRGATKPKKTPLGRGGNKSGK